MSDNNDELYISILTGPDPTKPLGIAGGNNLFSIKRTSATVHERSDKYTPAHELAHLLGRPHTPYCGAEMLGVTDKFHLDHVFYDSRLPNPYPKDPSENYMPSIGPIDDNVDPNSFGVYYQDYVFGFDSFEDPSNAFIAPQMKNYDYPILRPKIYHDLMSSCYPRWISNWTYKEVYNSINLLPKVQKGIVNALSVDSLYQVFRGKINFDNDVTIDINAKCNSLKIIYLGSIQVNAGLTLDIKMK